jgi:Ca2+-binding RTX toxin-like protein
MVTASIDHILGAEVERLTLAGSTRSGGGNGLGNQIDGNAAANVLTGFAGDDILRGFAGRDTLNGGQGVDTLEGGDGADTLDGGAGADRMDGGRGNDVYVVDNALDLVLEGSGAGRDRVEARVDWTLPGRVEDLTLAGGALVGIGNEIANAITGTAGANTLRGLAGADTLTGSGGSDVLIGGTGADVFRFLARSDSAPAVFDVIRAGDGVVAFEGAGAAAGDRIDVTGLGLAWGAGPGLGLLWAANVGTNTHVRGDTGSGGAWDFEIAIEDGAMTASAYGAADFIGLV